MSVASVVSQGFGAFANAYYVVTDGYGDFGDPPEPPLLPDTATNIIGFGRKQRALGTPTRGEVVRVT